MQGRQSIPLKSEDVVESYSRKNLCYAWRNRQKLADSFWKRWSQEYVTQLTAYKKWAQITPALQVGDLVLVSDDRLPRLRWKLGRIQEIFKGRDGLVHSTLVKTSQGVFRRRITVLHMLEAADTLKADKT